MSMTKYGVIRKGLTPPPQRPTKSKGKPAKKPPLEEDPIKRLADRVRSR